MKVFAIILFAIFALVYRLYYELTRSVPLPELDYNKYWGLGNGYDYKEGTAIKPFKVQVHPQKIVELQQLLNHTQHVAAPLENVTFDYGFNANILHHVVAYWQDIYLSKWPERQAYLNRLPQYTTQIQGLKVHFIHAKPSFETLNKKKKPFVLPVLLLHGWGGSIREFYDLIPLLTDSIGSNDYVFDVVAPSLNGFAWSEAAKKPGLHVAHMAIIMQKLMLRLGYERFLVQGGDWGAVIGSCLATIFPGNVIGYHSNMCLLHTPLGFVKAILASFQPHLYLPSKDLVRYHFPLSDKFWWLWHNSGYFHIQATKPDTIGIALLSNPVALAVWMLDIFQLFIDPNYKQKPEALAKAYDLDAVLDNLMIYYLSNSIITAGRIYKEHCSQAYTKLQMNRIPTSVPMGCARYRYDLPSAFDWQLGEKYLNIVHSRYYDKGGHFAALENSTHFYNDFIEFAIKINK